MTAHEPPFHRRVDGLLCLSFALAVATPLVATIARGRWPTLLTAENRRPAPRPELPRDWGSLTSYPAAFEAWWSDVFAGREELVRWHNALDLFVFHTTPNPVFFLGDEGWIFFTGDDSRRGWRGLHVLEETELEAWQRELEVRRDRLKARGIEYLFAIAPSKQSIYPEHLPHSERAVGPTPFDQLLVWMRAHSDVPFLDLRPALSAEREHDRPEVGDFVFYKLGTHWTPRGAWAGTQAIVSELSKRIPEMKPDSRSGFRSVLMSDSGDHDGVPERLHLESWLSEPGYGFVPTSATPARVTYADAETGVHGRMNMETDRSDAPVIFLEHDSFGEALRPHLALHASRLATIWQQALSVEDVLLARPRVVVQISTERRFIYAPEPSGSFADDLSQAVFEAAPRCRPDLDGAAMLRAIEPRAGTELSLEGSDGDASLFIRTRAERECVLLPELSARPRTAVALRIALTTPSRTLLTVWYQRRGAGRFEHDQRVAIALEEGRNDLCFAIPADGVVGRLLLRPGLEHGAYRLHALDMRYIAR